MASPGNPKPRAPAKPKAVVLLSGGLDSTTAAAWALSQGYQLVALSFDYGQKHRKELTGARAVAKALKIKKHLVLKLPVGELGGSALTDVKIAVPDAPKKNKIGASIPVTYVPARNTIFLSFALGYAEVQKAEAILIGANALDYSGYPDCRPEYLEAFEAMARLATQAGVEGRGIRILAPLVLMSKAEIVQLGNRLKAPLHLTWSCYRGGAKPCGKCESCVLRRKGFEVAKVVDPVRSA